MEDYQHELVTISTELAISGYPPRDLLLQPDFVRMSQQQASSLSVEIPVLVGTPVSPDGERKLPSNGVVRAGPLSSHPNGEQTNRVVTRKQLLPSYDVFDETRYFQASNRSGICRTIGDLDLGVTICEDAWQAAGMTPSEYGVDPIENLAEWGRQGVELDVTVNLSASPYHADKVGTRIQVCRTASKVLNHPFLLANQVGGNDDLLFDGCSLAAWPDGTVVIAPSWKEGVLLIDIDNPSNSKWISSTAEDSLEIGNSQIKFMSSNDDGFEQDSDLIEDITDAVVTGLSDYCRKSNISKIVLGLSGGIDSALVAAIAVDALGSKNVRCVMLPSEFTSKHSLDDARSIAKNLDCVLNTVPISEAKNAVNKSLSEIFKGLRSDVTEENIQSRIRGLLLMAMSNKFGEMLLTTGNKSEVAVGYATIYGDMSGGYNPLKDLYKTRVFKISKWRNENPRAWMLGPKKEIINSSILDKAPSAELRENQKDEDSLPDYEVLDSILKALIDDELSVAEIVEMGYDREVVKEIEHLIYISEYKRYQSAPGTKLSRRAFWLDRRYPIVNRWRDNS